MNNFILKLYLEINNSSYIFFVGKYYENEDFELIHKLEVPLDGIENNRISDFEKSFNTIKKNLYLIEDQFDYSFKEIILILENFNLSFINIAGHKNLNGSQILKENITYILNTLKSCVDETEAKKNILHIFNSEFNLDNKKIENLPIGLFGDFYSHELSFTLIDKNNYKNLKNIFDKCNLKIKKILSKSFIKGANISDNYNNFETFYYVKLNDKNIKIFYFENNALKSENNFNFGSSIIFKDISKITSLKMDTVKTILNKIEFKSEESLEDLVEEKFFNEDIYRKIKKRLIYEIALARIEEIFNIILFNNINFKYYNTYVRNIFLETDNIFKYKSLNKMYKKFFLTNRKLTLNLIENSSCESILNSANKIVHFGWKKEAIPISKSKKSIIAKFFSKIFR